MIETSHRQLVPQNIRDLKAYVAGKTIAEVKEEYGLSRVSKLASNENRLGCSPAVRSAILEALQEIQDYPDPISRQLRAALAERNGVSSDNVMVAAGSESVIGNLCRTFFSNTDNAITADATFVGFFVQANIRGISVKKVPVTKGYGFDLDAMAEMISDQTKMIYIANPNNPTGTYITKAEFEAFMNKVPEHVLVIMDEAYFEYARNIEDYPNSVDYSFDNVLTLRTFSKAYGLAGFRIGYCIGAVQLIQYMMKTKLTFEPTTLAQAAALSALNDKEFLNQSINVVEAGRDRLYRFFEERDVYYISSAANSVMMVLPDQEKAARFTQDMLEQGVILRHLPAFGVPEGVRITIGTGQEMDHFEQSFDKCYPSN